MDRRGRSVFLNQCSVIGTAVDPPLTYEVTGRDAASWRRKRLRQGIARWHKSVCDGPRPVEFVELLTLTSRSAAPAAAQGAIMAFWRGMRRDYPGLRYFSWLELQWRGAPHYHAIIVNPPWRTRGEAVARIRRHWRLGSITPNLKVRDGAWFVRAGGAYVRKYANKAPQWSGARGSGPGTPRRPVDVHYQQDYSDVPRELRTFQHQVLEHAMDDVDVHLDRAEWRYVPEQVTRGGFEPAYVQLMQRLHHRCGRPMGNIRLRQRKRPSQQARPRGAHGGNGVTSTAAPPTG